MAQISNLHYPRRNGFGNGLMAVQNAELANQIAEMKVSSSLSDSKLYCDIVASHAVCCMVYALVFPLGQRQPEMLWPESSLDHVTHIQPMKDMAEMHRISHPSLHGGADGPRQYALTTIQ